MTSQSRESRRENRLFGRAPAIWRGPQAAASAAPAAPRPQVKQRGTIFVSWRVLSGALIVILLAVLSGFFISDAFYVHQVAVGGLTYMSSEEIFALTAVADLHIFWVDPAEVRENLLRSPSIANAVVQTGWPPHLVRIQVEEREPALIWEQSGSAYWIDIQGRVMRLRADRDDLMRITTDPVVEGEPGAAIDVNVVTGALQLHTLLPDVSLLRYHPDDGLGYSDPRGWQVWLGTGTNMPEKIRIYAAIADDLVARDILPISINVANPDAPYYTRLSG
ncbi:MAG: FtsQ-type POTRA domain-containing protein [Chloroflexi bacterium]|nr:FtsQ-type POTRA domain-containing protein [Chloroflexota bacterium]